MRAEKQDTQIRKEQIVQAVLRVVAREGLSGLSVGAVAQEVGFVPSAIYRHYRNKDEMLEAVLDLVARRLMENVQAARRESEDPLLVLKHLLLRHLRLLRGNPAVMRLVFSEDFYAGHPARKKKVLGIIQGYLGQVAELVREGRRSGRIRPDADPEAAALMFLGMVQPAAFIWRMGAGFDLLRHGESAWRMFCRALEEPGSGPPGKRERSAR